MFTLSKRNFSYVCVGGGGGLNTIQTDSSMSTTNSQATVASLGTSFLAGVFCYKQSSEFSKIIDFFSLYVISAHLPSL